MPLRTQRERLKTQVESRALGSQRHSWKGHPAQGPKGPFVPPPGGAGGHSAVLSRTGSRASCEAVKLQVQGVRMAVKLLPHGTWKKDGLWRASERAHVHRGQSAPGSHGRAQKCEDLIYGNQKGLLNTAAALGILTTPNGCRVGLPDVCQEGTRSVC